MTDRRRHRGRHPEDDRLFASAQHTNLRKAVADLSWLLSRQYAPVSAMALVGDRYGLEQRQRIAVARCACSDQQLHSRLQRQTNLAQARARGLAIDGFNLLTTIEAALAGGVLLVGRDGCLRDMASVHGTYRKVLETLPAIDIAVGCLQQWDIRQCRWYLDSPVSNSGRLAELLREAADRHGVAWQVELVSSPDHVLLQETEAVVATADSVILDGCGEWLNLAWLVLSEKQLCGDAIAMAG